MRFILSQKVSKKIPVFVGMQIQIQDDPLKLYYFLYNDKKYLFNIDLFNISSQYFLNYPEKIQNNQIIQLIDKSLDGNITFSDKSIQDFINYFQRKPITLDNSNTVELNYLSKKYEINSLIQATNQYIEEHNNDNNLIFQLLLIYQYHEAFTCETYENIISNHLSEYINNDLMLTLSVPVVYRILNKNKDSDKPPQLINDIIEFLFKYLSKYGGEASILFTLIDANNLTKEQINRLFNEYSNFCDLNFFNPCLLKRIYDNQNVTIDQLNKQKKIALKQKEKIQNNLAQIKDEIRQLKQKQENDLTNFKEEIQNFKKKVKSKMQFLVDLDANTLNKKDIQTKKRILYLIQFFKTNCNTTNIINILNYLQTIDINSKGVFFFQEKDQTQKIQISCSKIMISKKMTEKLYERNQILSTEFINHIKNFSEFYIEIKYPTEQFENIYRQVVELKHSQNHVKISVFVIEIEKFDIFLNYTEINNITFSSYFIGNEDDNYKFCSSH